MSNKLEKLKNNTVISSLFKEGKSINNYPFRLVYFIQEEQSSDSFLVSVSKKNVKKAVDRNRIKRQLKAVINKMDIYHPNPSKRIVFCVSYIGSKKPTFLAIQKGLNETFRIFNKKLSTNEKA